MKRYVVVGLGNFGFTVAKTLGESSHDVIAIDMDGALVDRIAPFVSHAAVGDATSVDTLRAIGAADADVGVVSTGDDISSSILATMALRDVHIKDVFVKVVSNDHARVMNRFGATDIVFPERDSAVGLATRIRGAALLNYVKLGNGFSLQEMGVPESWIGQSIRKLKLRQTYEITIVALHDILSDKMVASPNPDHILRESDTLIVAGNDSALEKLSKQK